MKKQISASSDVEGLISAIEGLDEDISRAVNAGLVAMGEQAKRDLQSSYLSLVPFAKAGDYIYTSLDSHVFTTDNPSSNSKGNPWLSVGSYEYTKDNPDIRTSFGRTKSDMLPSQLAYWVEHGTARLNSGKRKPKSISWDEVPDSMYTVTMSPKPFISNAAISGWDAQESAFVAAFNNEITK